MVEKLGNNIENPEKKYKEFLELLKTNPEAIESQVVKNKYRELLGIAFESAKIDSRNWASYVVPGLLKLEILEKSEIKEQYKELLKMAFERAKSDRAWAEVVIELLKLEILEKSEIKEQYKELLKTAFEKAKSDRNWTEYVMPKLLKLNILNESEIKERYKELLEIAFINAEVDWHWAVGVVPALLKLEILEKSDKVRYKKLWETVLERAKIDEYWVRHIVPALLKLEILEKSDKERYKKLLEIAFNQAKVDGRWAYSVVPTLLKLEILEKSDKERYKKLLETAFERAKSDGYWAGNIVPELLKLEILEKSDKKRYKKLLETAFERAKSDSNSGWVIHIIPELLKLEILGKSDKKRYKKLLGIAFERAKSDRNWAEYVLSGLLKLEILEKSEIKEQYKELLKMAFERAKSDRAWAEVVIELLKLEILEKSEIKEQYKELLKIAFEKAKSDRAWAVGVVPTLLKLEILEKSDKERYKKLLEIAFERAKSDSDWAEYIVPGLLKLEILEKSDKERYRELLERVFENAKSESDHIWMNSDADWAIYIVPELLKLNILDKSEINFDISLLQNVTLVGISFLEKNKNKIGEHDIEFINQMDDCFSKEEIEYLYKHDYEYFKGIEIVVKEKDYQKIWEIKKECYPQEEKNKLQKMEEYFGEGVWQYFVDKVRGNKLLKNRFRDPHNALLHTDEIIDLAKQLETKGISKEEFIKNYLGVAGDRNNGYQQLNNFLEKYDSGRKESVQGAMNMTEFKENIEFMNLAEGILEQEKTGELYKNLDNLEQILTLLNMIRNKEALIKLQKLAKSKDPKDQKLYEYYKGAIYHPRTKPIIMKMYEDPREFLGLDDTTFSSLKRIHQAKKPLNMVENFEYLDFDAKDLVDCLPLGIYDQLSYFKPFEMKFYISGSDVFTKEEIQEKVIEFLKSVDQKKITNIIKKLKEHGDETMLYQIWKENKGKFIDELTTKYALTDLIDMFVGLGYSEFNKYKDLRLMTAKISPKRDPNNRFNGFNCDSLAEGHGKKVVAMFNPYCTDFCVYEGEQDPKEDNLKVTSWVTLNRAIPENFETLLNRVKSETTHDIANVLGDKFEDYKDPNEYVITMDNIEANPNFGRKNELAVRKMYEKFFSEYVRQNPMSPNGIPINTHKFYSGVNYNKLNILTDKVPNESLPVFVNAYSDNSASYSLQGNLDAGEQKEKEKKIGIYPLSIEDVVQISYMEGKIYPSSMKDHLGNLQHEITASILNNTLKGRSNLSFARYDEEGKIGGYILAYQGKMEDGTPGIYISDFAMDKKYRGPAGIKMIHHWMKEVKEKYPDMSVFTRAREETSYRMIEAYAEKQGYEITRDEIVEDGGENFHRVVMKPKR